MNVLRLKDCIPQEARPDLTPMIDVVFLLLAFLVFNLPLTDERQIETYLPKQVQATTCRCFSSDLVIVSLVHTQLDASLNLTSKSVKALRFERQNLNRLGSLEEAEWATDPAWNKLCARLAEILAWPGRRARLQVTLIVSDLIPYKFVIRTIDAITKSGCRHLVIDQSRSTSSY